MSASKELRTWRRMIARCYDEGHHRYEQYGARGIAVCERWRNSYADFKADMGPSPTPEHTIEREDNDGNYTPENCRWATWREQAQNRRTSRHLKQNGKKQTVAAWAREKGMDRRVLWKRLFVWGWSIKDAINKPVAKRTRRTPVPVVPERIAA